MRAPSSWKQRAGSISTANAPGSLDLRYRDSRTANTVLLRATNVRDALSDIVTMGCDKVTIAWETGNVYWIYDGYHQALTRYDFAQDHGRGGSDHSDGIIERYADGLMGYLPGVPSHIEWDASQSLLYVADAETGAIRVLNPNPASAGADINPNYDGTLQRIFNGSSLSTLIAKGTVGLDTPSGLALYDNRIYVADYATGRIFAFDLNGEVVDYLDTGRTTALMGMAIGSDGAIYVVDNATKEVLRISAKS